MWQAPVIPLLGPGFQGHLGAALILLENAVALSGHLDLSVRPMLQRPPSFEQRLQAGRPAASADAAILHGRSTCRPCFHLGVSHAPGGR